MYDKQIQEARHQYDKFITEIDNYNQKESPLANLVKKQKIHFYTKKIPAEPTIFSIIQIEECNILIDEEAIEANVKINNYNSKLYPFFFGGIQVAHLLLKHSNIHTEEDDKKKHLYFQGTFPLYQITDSLSEEEIQANFLAKELMVPHQQLINYHNKIYSDLNNVEAETANKNNTLKSRLIIDYLSDTFHVDTKLISIILQERKII